MDATAANIGFINTFEKYLHQVLNDPRHAQAEPRVLMDASRHLAFADGAKRMRPMLVNHFGDMAALAAEARIRLAVAGELIHTASLLHDDVVDDGSERRGRPTANARWHNSVAVLSGDLVLCIALEQLESLPQKITIEAIELVAEMTRAAMLEVRSRRRQDWTLDDWTVVARGKTGALLAWCGAAPALATDQPELALRLKRCGHHLGIAFQLADDLVDLTGIEAGKDSLNDLRQANPSYIVGLAREMDPDLRRRIDNAWQAPTTPDDRLLRSFADEIKALGCPQATVTAIEEHVADAHQALGDLDTSSTSLIVEWTTQLLALARRCLNH